MYTYYSAMYEKNGNKRQNLSLKRFTDKMTDNENDSAIIEERKQKGWALNRLRKKQEDFLRGLSMESLRKKAVGEGKNLAKRKENLSNMTDT